MRVLNYHSFVAESEAQKINVVAETVFSKGMNEDVIVKIECGLDFDCYLNDLPQDEKLTKIFQSIRLKENPKIGYLKKND